MAFARALAPAAVLALHTTWASAQSAPLVLDNMPNIVALAVGIAPDYIGSDDYTFVAGPSGRISIGDKRYVEVVATQVAVNLLDHPYLRAGVLGNYRFGRSDVSDDVVDRMEDVDDTVEVGFFFGVELINAVNPRTRIRAGVDVLGDVGGEHDSFLTTVSARYWMPLGRAVDFGIGAALTYGGSGYMDRYFGVSGADAARSGLSQFEAESGLRDLQISPALVLHLSPQWHLGAGFQYRRLVDDAARSPLTDDRGSKDQFLAGVAAGCSW